MTLMLPVGSCVAIAVRRLQVSRLFEIPFVIRARRDPPFP